MVKFNIKECEKALHVALKYGILKSEDLRSAKIIDFGCGRGVSTALLAHYGADVTGLEISEISVNQSRDLPFVPHDRILHVDGLTHMNSLPKGSVDISHALWLGPDTGGSLIREFFSASAHCLKPGGIIIISSDPGTIDTVQKLNPLGNGFCEGNVFVAIRPIEMPSSQPFSLPDRSSMPLHPFTESAEFSIGSIMEKFDPSRFEEIFRKLKEDGTLFRLSGLPGDKESGEQ